MSNMERVNNIISGTINCPHCNASNSFEEGEGKLAVLPGEGIRCTTDLSGANRNEKVMTFDLIFQCSSCGYTVKAKGETVESID